MTGRPGRAAALIHALGLQPHPEGGHYREWFRSAAAVVPGDGRGERRALTCIDFLLVRGQFSAWHRVAGDELWHLLEGGPLRLWWMDPAGQDLGAVELAADAVRHHAVPAGWWQAAEPLGEFALCAATVAPGFEFADFAFLRDDAAACAALQARRAELTRLL